MSATELDRRGDVADGVKAPVGRRQFHRLADDRAAGLLDHALEQREVRLRDVAWDRIELVERAAGMPEAAARDHRHVGAAGGEHRRQHQRNVVADAAGRVLVENRARQVVFAPIEACARAGHGAGQRHALLERHAAKEDRHGEGRGLAFGDRAAGQASDEVADLARAQCFAVALGANDFLWKDHRGFGGLCPHHRPSDGPPPPPPKPVERRASFRTPFRGMGGSKAPTGAAGSSSHAKRGRGTARRVVEGVATREKVMRALAHIGG